MNSRRTFLTVLALSLSLSPALASAQDIEKELEAIRKAEKVPSLAVTVLKNGQQKTLKAVGMRKLGDSTPVTSSDKYHLGSCTKAMTATLLAVLVEEGKLEWTTTLAEVFPKMAMHPAYQQVTILHLLTHRSGLPTRTWPKGKSFLEVHGLDGNQRQQRLTYVKLMLKEAPEAKAGEKFIYSNAGYTVAGAVAETVCDKGYQALIAEKLFKPLGIKSYGSGAMGQADKLDQPWPHRYGRDKVVPIRPGPFADNPPAIAPAGTLHMSLSDWAKFIQLHLQAYNGNPKVLSKKTLKLLHNPIFGGGYALGWAVTSRPWGKGRVLVHNGSNNMNFCVVWMAPKADFAVMIACNAGGPNAAKACDRVAGLMIRHYLTSSKKAPKKTTKKRVKKLY